jgi:hypothetical protein
VLDPATFDVLGTLTGDQGYAVSGEVAMVRSRDIRRTCVLRLANPDGDFTPVGPGSWLFFNSLVRLERGVYLDETHVEWCVLGHFLLGRPRVDVTPAGASIEVQGEDRMKLLVRSRFVTPTTYAAGTRLGELIGTEAEVAGMGDYPTGRYRLDDGGRTLARARTFEEDESRIEALGNLAHDYGLELFADADGFLALGEPPNATTAPLAWSYAAGSDAIHLGLTKEWTDDRLYNHVIVTGEASDMPPVRAEAKDLNPASPAYIGGPLGDRVYRYTSSMVSSVPQAQEVADNLLATVALIEESVELPQVVNPALEPGDAVSIAEPLSRTDARYLIDQLNVPLAFGTQVLGTKVARPLA